MFEPTDFTKTPILTTNTDVYGNPKIIIKRFTFIMTFVYALTNNIFRLVFLSGTLSAVPLYININNFIYRRYNNIKYL